jgi:UDP-N-acetylmuramoyl-tripeptide--D-alanyl-D-alanine ligase
MTELQITREWLDWDSTGADLAVESEKATLRIPGISLEARAAAIEMVRGSFAAGTSLVDAIDASLGEDFAPGLPLGELLADDVVMVDASHVVEASRAVDVTKSVSALARGTRRVVAVAGALDFSGASDYDNLSAFGAFMVRLNVTQVFAVGRGARALFLSVGMEGSWDGESRFCEDSVSAYDDIRAHIRPGDVLLVLGSTDESFTALVQRLRDDLA